MNNADLQIPFQDALLPGLPPGEAVDMDRIMAAITGELPLEERLEVIDRCALDRQWAAAWGQAKQMLELRDEPAPVSQSASPLPANRRFPMWAIAGTIGVAFAALAIGALLLGSPATPTYRSSGESSIHATSTAALPRGEARLQWAGIPADAQVVLTVQDSHLRSVANASGLGLDSYLIPAALLEGLPAQTELMWSVQITHPDGRIERSPTFRTPLQD